MPRNKTSWLNFIGDMQQHRYAPEQLQIEGMEKILNVNELTNSVFNHSIPWIYLLDYTSGKYMLVSRSMKLMLGFEPDDLMNEGLAWTMENYHADHLRLYSEDIFPDRLQILKSIAPQDHCNYIFTYNFQFKTRNGEYVRLLQRNCFVKSDDKGNPLLSFGVIMNVNHFTPANPITQVVEKLNNGNLSDGIETVFKKDYFLNKEEKLFTKREKELLLWMECGLTSKEIAGKMFISEHTVINHRRKMMSKCNARNVTEMVSFAIRQKII